MFRNFFLIKQVYKTKNLVDSFHVNANLSVKWPWSLHWLSSSMWWQSHQV